MHRRLKRRQGGYLEAGRSPAVGTACPNAGSGQWGQMTRRPAGRHRQAGGALMDVSSVSAQIGTGRSLTLGAMTL